MNTQDWACSVRCLRCCVQDESLVVSLIQRHLKYTKSAVARAILNDWQNAKQSFVKVFPHEYARALAEKGTTEASCSWLPYVTAGLNHLFAAQVASKSLPPLSTLAVA